jgi:cytochrome c2
MVQAAERAGHPVVPGFERFYADAKSDAVRGGQLLMGELNCLSCHSTAETAYLRKQAPVLDGVANRIRISYLRKFLRDPQAVKPGTTMPGLFAADPAAAEKVEALVHFLGTTGALRHLRPEPKSVAQGRDLYHKAGCVACHGTRDATGNPDMVPAGSVPLGDLKAKYSLAGLAGFLENPHQVRPSGRMPKLLDGTQARQVANYLLPATMPSLTPAKGRTTYAYYEGSWQRVPAFRELKPVRAGLATGFDLGVAQREHHFGIQFEGFFKVEREGNYAFSVHSDDGAILSVDGKPVVNNDGVHPPSTGTGSVRLRAGVHRVTVGFIQAGGGAELEVSLDLPGLGRHDLGNLVAPTAEGLAQGSAPAPKGPDEDLLEFQPGLAEKGKALFTSLGCANCHLLNPGKGAIASSLKNPALDKLKGEGGCLAEAPAQGLPRYALDAAQRRALAAAVASRTALKAEPTEVIARTLMAFNCYACHSRDKVGGPTEELNKSFQTTQPEMGDEGRVPPPLDGVGAKLTADYLRHLLDSGAHDRPYMHTRMPGFGAANVGHLVAAFAAVDRLPVAAAVPITEPLTRVKVAARHLVGGMAFGCVKCHTFNGQKAEGVQGIDMTLMPRRLRRDWFFAYILDPQRIRPGTRMPAAFFQGKSPLPNILGGKPESQIEAMWVYLLDGGAARAPAGVLSHSIPLVPSQSAILYRNFISGSGTRAIGVGYPEKANLTFDANELRLSMLWQGAFMDAGRHWNGRGEGSEGPLGDNILHLHAGPAFAILATADQPWPTAKPKELGYRFLGYRLTPDDRPTFLYAMGDLRVEDFPNGLTGKDPSLRRTLTLTAPQPVEGLYFRAAAANKIEPAGDGWYRIDATWKLKVESAAPPRLRSSAGKTELLVPIRGGNGKLKVGLEYVW